MKPYRNISSKHLPLMLLLARTLAYVGGFAFVVGIILLASSAFLRTGVMGVTSGAALLPFAFSVLVVSTLLAAIVAFEESYRIRTEHLTRSNETQ